MTKGKSFLLHATIIHDLLPFHTCRAGKTSREVTAMMRRDGYDVSHRSVHRALDNMIPIFGLQRHLQANGSIRWKRTREITVGHCFRIHDFQGEPLDFEWDDPDSGLLQHAMPEFQGGR